MTCLSVSIFASFMIDEMPSLEFRTGAVVSGRSLHPTINAPLRMQGRTRRDKSERDCSDRLFG